MKVSGQKGGPGSGYHAPHSGRPGQLGGSRPRGRRAEFVGIGSWFLRTGTLGVVYPASVDGQWEFHRLEDDEVFTINDEDLEIEEKGGEGSGHHDHAGRPGHVGGSKPSGQAEPKKEPAKAEKPKPKKEPVKDKPAYIDPRPTTLEAPEEAQFHDLHNGVSTDEKTQRLNAAFNAEASAVPDEDGNNWDYASDEESGQLKAQIVATLAERSGLSPELVNEMVKQWAQTSNDSIPSALMLQRLSLIHI